MSHFPSSPAVEPARTVVNTDVLDIALDDATRDTLREMFAHEALSPYSQPEAAIRVAARLFRQGLPDEVMERIERFNLDPGSLSAIHLSNLPIDATLPVTPPDGHDVSGKQTFVSEGILLGIGRVFGHPYAFKDEKRGQIVQQICPVPASAKKLSNESSLADLGMHIENSFSDFRPHQLLLLCLRGDRDHSAMTRIASGQAIASRLDPEHLAAARLPEFRLQCPVSFSTDGQTVYSEPVAIFSGPPAHEEFRIDLPAYMDFVTDRAAEAYSAIQAVLTEPGVVRSIDLQAGDAIVLNNRKITHGRTVFEPRYDGQDRWLQRMFIISDTWPMRALVDHRLRVI